LFEKVAFGRPSGRFQVGAGGVSHRIKSVPRPDGVAAAHHRL